MFPAKYTQLIFSFFLSIFMSCVVSAVSVFNTTGLIDGFFNLWMTAWLKSWIVAFPTILIVAPLTRRLVGKLVRNTPSWTSLIKGFCDEIAGGEAAPVKSTLLHANSRAVATEKPASQAWLYHRQPNHQPVPSTVKLRGETAPWMR